MDEGPSERGLAVRDLLGLGGYLAATIVVGMLLGWLLDRLLDTAPVFVLIGLAVGVAGGIAGCWVRIRQFLG